MNWDAVGAIAEVGGAFGVIATLLYLAVQIRHSSKSERASMQHAVLSEFRTLASQMYFDEKLAHAHQCLAEGREIPPETKERYLYWIANIFRIYEEIHEFSQNNLISTDFWEARRKHMRDVYLAHPEVKDWWRNSKKIGFFSSRFRNLGNELVKELDGT